jgi:hypothetical protein
MKSAGWIFTGKSEKKTTLQDRAPNPLFTAKGAPRNGGGAPPPKPSPSKGAAKGGAGGLHGWNTNAPEFIPSAPPAATAYPGSFPSEWNDKGRWQSQGWRKWTDGVPSEHEQFDMWEKEWNTAKMKDGKILVVLVDGKPSADFATLAAATTSTNGAKAKQTSSPYEANGARKAKGKATKSTKMGWKPKATAEKDAPAEAPADKGTTADEPDAAAKSS